MGAMARQVVQVKRKNSTNCTPPEARLIVVGSVASRFGPREVATACSVGAGVAVKSAIDVTVNSTMMGVAVTTSGDLLEVSAGAQAANKTTSRLRPVLSVVEGPGKRRLFLISL